MPQKKSHPVANLNTLLDNFPKVADSFITELKRIYSAIYTGEISFSRNPHFLRTDLNYTKSTSNQEKVKYILLNRPTQIDKAVQLMEKRHRGDNGFTEQMLFREVHEYSFERSQQFLARSSTSSGFSSDLSSLTSIFSIRDSSKPKIKIGGEEISTQPDDIFSAFLVGS